MSFSYSTVGFIGLGTMGYPMVENLVAKLPPSAKIFVFDVSKEALKRITVQNQGRVQACSSAKEMAEKSVRTMLLVMTTLDYVSEKNTRITYSFLRKYY
jgi:3-hydroxyisobutyrate dehydrogenase